MASGIDTIEVDGWQILVGRSARDNDELSLRVAAQRDLWLHAAGHAGSHVVIRCPDGADPPREVVEHAARLAVWHSKARKARGKVEVHACRAKDVSKERGAPAGQVRIRDWWPIRIYAPNVEP